MQSKNYHFAESKQSQMAKWNILPNEAYLFYSKAIEFIVNFAEYFRGREQQKKMYWRIFFNGKRQVFEITE